MNKVLASSLIIIILVLSIASYLNLEIPINLSNVSKTTTTTTKTVSSPIVVTVPGEKLKFSEASLYLPAVDSAGNGVVTLLKVRSIPGDGRILVDIKNLGFFTDTQQSIRTAVDVAQKETGINTSAVDLTYTIEGIKNNGEGVGVVEGPSAGAALTISTIAALDNKPLNRNVMITGTINSDGTIGKIGGVPEKIDAAKSINATLFLLPEGQGGGVTYKPQRQCEQVGALKYCVIAYKEQSIDASQQYGIIVREVSNVTEALKYFIS